MTCRLLADHNDRQHRQQLHQHDPDNEQNQQYMHQQGRRGSCGLNNKHRSCLSFTEIDCNKPIRFPVMVSTFARGMKHQKTSVNRATIVDHHAPRPIVVKQSAPVRQSVMSLLRIDTIQLGMIEERKEATFFKITTRMCNGQSFETSRRYNDFVALSKGLGKCADIEMNRAQLPRKHLFICTGRKLLVRKQKLLLWLHRALHSFVKFCQECSAYKTFLTPKSSFGMSKHLNCVVAQLLFNEFLEITDEDRSQQFCRSPYPPVAEEVASCGQELQIQVPLDVQAGQVMTFSVADGKKISARIPHGVVGGSLWHLWYNSDMETLTSLPSRKYIPELYLEGQQGSLLEITVPLGCKAGEPIVVVIPGGRRMTLTLPRDFVAGSALQMWFEPIEKSLTML
eukprot:gnl/MRDRNA2_/MRDRNA2_106510_c0_seq1.p1 gnl/MRDRNA2_/MRDRNA2_106510_c0~~gnl/MRDRNA2_/MRDRNA2_106510_c0_seq1.p1  ORF type:complete len:396 (-),score=53.54 gnl/MRDRNA2_/MRDRNA2_106510_c0_seq1:75-1262(-)